MKIWHILQILKIWHILQILNVDICWKLQSRIFKVKPDKTVSWIWNSSKSVKTFWHIAPKPVGWLTWFFRSKRKIVTELLVQNFKPVALKTSELLRFKVKVAPYIADRASHAWKYWLIEGVSAPLPYFDQGGTNRPP